ncbi:hypothetical protein GOP47_0019959 [Adiantum capillus-veneris]|uniref:Uncharacterized protein n=1 Tax=Adiantum capillus-veneris TaxID=13818 RepID=A0A9D4UDG5_ADICA|nr:hypothetical protein GOP47_0019959 [Adiantum capillus-veneris]
MYLMPILLFLTSSLLAWRTSAPSHAVKAPFRANFTQLGSIFIPGASKGALRQMKHGETYVNRSLVDLAAQSTFLPKTLLARSYSSHGSLSAESGTGGMCTWPLLAKRASYCSSKFLCSTKGGLLRKSASQNTQRSVVVLPHLFLQRTFSTESPPPNHCMSLIKQSMEGLKNMAGRYKQAVILQIEGFWRRNVLILVGVAGILACYLLWRIMYGVAGIFVSFSERMAKTGLLAVAASTVAFMEIILKNRYTINPDKVYRIIMRTLNTSPTALEVLGAPLTGSDLRVYIMSGGGLKLKNFKPTFSHKRCFLMFPVQGTERKGLVSAEVKKKKGKYDIKLLATDVASPGPKKRVILIGDEKEYKAGGGLLAQLRMPILKAMSAQKEFDAQDEKEAEEEERAEEASREQELKEETQRSEEIGRLGGH